MKQVHLSISFEQVGLEFGYTQVSGKLFTGVQCFVWEYLMYSTAQVGFEVRIGKLSSKFRYSVYNNFCVHILSEQSKTKGTQLFPKEALCTVLKNQKSIVVIRYKMCVYMWFCVTTNMFEKLSRSLLEHFNKFKPNTSEFDFPILLHFL